MGGSKKVCRYRGTIVCSASPTTPRDLAPGPELCASQIWPPAGARLSRRGLVLPWLGCTHYSRHAPPAVTSTCPRSAIRRPSSPSYPPHSPSRSCIPCPPIHGRPAPKPVTEDSHSRPPRLRPCLV